MKDQLKLMNINKLYTLIKLKFLRTHNICYNFLLARYFTQRNILLTYNYKFQNYLCTFSLIYNNKYQLYHLYLFALKLLILIQ